MAMLIRSDKQGGGFWLIRVQKCGTREIVYRTKATGPITCKQGCRETRHVTRRDDNMRWSELWYTTSTGMTKVDWMRHGNRWLGGGRADRAISPTHSLVMPLPGPPRLWQGAFFGTRTFSCCCFCRSGPSGDGSLPMSREQSRWRLKWWWWWSKSKPLKWTGRLHNDLRPHAWCNQLSLVCRADANAPKTWLLLSYPTIAFSWRQKVGKQKSFPGHWLSSYIERREMIGDTKFNKSCLSLVTTAF